MTKQKVLKNIHKTKTKTCPPKANCMSWHITPCQSASKLCVPMRLKVLQKIQKKKTTRILSRAYCCYKKCSHHAKWIIKLVIKLHFSFLTDGWLASKAGRKSLWLKSFVFQFSEVLQCSAVQLVFRRKYSLFKTVTIHNTKFAN